jgi:hypothetical protein
MKSWSVFTGNEGVTTKTRCDVPDDVKSQVWVQRGIDDVRRQSKEQRVAVWSRLCRQFRGKTAGRRWPIVDDELLAQPLREGLSDDSPVDVGRGAGRETDDDTHRPRRIIERRCDMWHGWQCGCACCQMQKFAAGKFHVVMPYQL